MTRAKNQDHSTPEKTEKPNYKRQQYWVDAPLQLQMVGFVLIIVSASLLLTAFSVYRGMHEASIQSRQIFHSLEWIKSTLRAPLLLASAISLLASGLMTLFWSHRFAGPLRVISSGVVRMRHGNFAIPVRIRLSDGHQEFAREFQEMQEELRRMLEADRARIHAAKAHLEAGEIAKALEELRHTCTKYHL